MKAPILTQLMSRRSKKIPIAPPQTNLIGWWTAGVNCKKDWQGTQPATQQDDQVYVVGNRVAGGQPLWFPVDGNGNPIQSGYDPPSLNGGRIEVNGGQLLFIKGSGAGTMLANSLAMVLYNANPQLTIFLRGEFLDVPVLTSGIISYYDGNTQSQDWTSNGCTPAFSLGVYFDGSTTTAQLNYDQASYRADASTLPGMGATKLLIVRIDATGDNLEMVSPTTTTNHDSGSFFDYGSNQPSPANDDYAIFSAPNDGGIYQAGSGLFDELLIYHAALTPTQMAAVVASINSRF